MTTCLISPVVDGYAEARSTRSYDSASTVVVTRIADDAGITDLEWCCVVRAVGELGQHKCNLRLVEGRIGYYEAPKDFRSSGDLCCPRRSAERLLWLI